MNDNDVNLTKLDELGELSDGELRDRLSALYDPEMEETAKAILSIPLIVVFLHSFFLLIFLPLCNSKGQVSLCFSEFEQGLVAL